MALMKSCFESYPNVSLNCFVNPLLAEITFLLHLMVLIMFTSQFFFHSRSFAKAYLVPSQASTMECLSTVVISF